MSFRCPTCGDLHEGLPHISVDKPDHWWDVPEEEREHRIQLTSDTCIIDDEDFFIRGVIERSPTSAEKICARKLC